MDDDVILANQRPIRLEPVDAFRVLLGCIAVLTLANAVVLAGYLTGHENLLGFSRLFDVNAEGNVPTLFSVLQLSAVATCLSVIGAHQCGRGAREAGRRWWALAAIAGLLAVDESVGLHELLRDAMRARGSYTGLWYFAWTIPYSLFSVIVVLAFWRFVIDLPARTRNSLMVAAGLYVGSAIGMEMLAGWLLTAARFGPDHTPLMVAVSYSLEELGEILAVSLALFALLQHAASLGVEVAAGKGAGRR